MRDSFLNKSTVNGGLNVTKNNISLFYNLISNIKYEFRLINVKVARYIFYRVLI